MKSMEPLPQSISEFQGYFKGLFGNSNKDRNVEYIYSYLTRNCSYLSRSILREGDNKNYFVKSFSWLFALSEKLEINLEEALRKKFPDVCPYCISSPCICAETAKKPPQYKAEWEIKRELEHKYLALTNFQPAGSFSINNAVLSVNKIYPANRAVWAAYGSTYHFSRLFEEIGEVHEAYGAFVSNERTIANTRDELADVFAWLLSAWGIQNKETPLSDALIEYYYEGCPVCRSNPCKCHDYSSRVQSLVRIEDLDEFKQLIVEVLKLSPEKSASLLEISTSLDTVKESKSTTEAKRVVAQGLEVLNQVEKATSSTASVAKSIKSIVESATLAVKAFTWF